jgi:hypothetical protein
MPLSIHAGAPTLCIRREAYERSGLTRAAIDQRLNLTPDEFRVEADLVAIGPLFGAADALGDLVTELEGLGLEYFEDFFELSGNWPEWLTILATSRATRTQNTSSSGTPAS